MKEVFTSVTPPPQFSEPLTIIATEPKEETCSFNDKIVGFFFVSKYLIKKYGWAKAIEIVQKRKRK